MRALPLLAIAACAGPTGTAQTWPPSLGVTIAAATFADLDGDGALDIAIAATGGKAGEGLYLVKGGTDWDGATIRSFSRFVPHVLADVAALAIVGDTLALAYTVKGTATLETLDRGTLATIDKTALSIASKQHLAITAVELPGGMPRAAILGDDDIVQVDLAAPAALHEIPPPSGTKWLQPQTALGFADGALAVATATQSYRSILGATPPAYQALRPAGDTAALTAQTAVALSTTAGARITAIMGIDVAGKRLCAIDVTATIGAACFAISIDPTARFAIASGALDARPGTDVSIVEAGAKTTVIVTYMNLALDGAVLTSGSLIGAGGVHVPVTSPIVTVVPAIPGLPAHLFALGIDGQTACLGMANC